MAFDRVSLTGLDRFIDGMTQEDLAIFTNAETDPALVIPAFPGVGDPDPAPTVPSQEEIEEALVAHVCGGPAPRDLIANLFAPFVDPRFIDLDPGKGQKRPSYALAISTYGFSMRRAPTAVIAAELHAIATSLAQYAVGDRAPQDAPELVLTARGPDYHSTTISIKAGSIAAARSAYLAAFGTQPLSVSVPLPLGADEIIPHICAARQILADGAAGAPRMREKAVALIAAAEDIRTVATAILRRHPDISSFERLSFEIALAEGFNVTGKDERSERGSSHAEMQFLARHRDLLEVLKRTAQRHKVLLGLPDTFVLRLHGTSTYLDARFVDTSAPRHDPNCSISSLDYDDVGNLAERLENLGLGGAPRRAQWRLSLTGGRFRSSRDWRLNGETLAQALAKAAGEDSVSASMKLMDLAIDLFGDEDGKPPRVLLHRVL
jgi:hypothetical protein